MSGLWTADRIPDLTGQVAVVTGATSGLGLAAARELAGRGARVVLAVRDTARGDRVAAGIAGAVEVRRLDLADLASVQDFAEGWSGDLDLLIANAGVSRIPLGRTVDGFEMHLGTNHLGHFALTIRLLPHLTDRVVVVGSLEHRAGRIDFDDLNWDHRAYRPSAAYSQSKLANLLFMLELQRRLTALTSRVRVLAAHPGSVLTELQTRTGSRLKNRLAAVGTRLTAQSVTDGLQPILFAATADIPGGSYVGPSGFQEFRGSPTLVGRSRAASDPDLAERLWIASASLTGTDFS